MSRFWRPPKAQKVPANAVHFEWQGWHVFAWKTKAGKLSGKIFRPLSMDRPGEFFMPQDPGLAEAGVRYVLDFVALPSPAVLVDACRDLMGTSWSPSVGKAMRKELA